MAKQYLSERNVLKLTAMTGQPYRYALVRGNWHDKSGRWCEAFLPSESSTANIDWVNRDTGEVRPYVRDGQTVKECGVQ